ncbi:MAG: tetratricopeptide repeat protein [Candidatus Zixiibacteriota bacterium]|nr:MAG: tetratricopeptide repeat protein [candidate division Zixibacteria bacterium]
MRSLRVALVIALVVFVGGAVWGQKPKKKRQLPASTYKTTGKIFLKDTYSMFDSAVVILEEGVGFYPEDAEMHFLLGKAYHEIKDYGAMGEHFAAAESLKSDAKWIDELNSMREDKWMQVYNQGVAAYREQDFDTAIEKFMTCTRISPSDARAFWLYGDTYRVKGDYDRALEILDAGLKLDPENPQILRSYADVLFFSGKAEEALESYGRVMENDPDNVDVLFNMATLQYNAKEYDKAIESFQKLITIDPTFKDAYFNMGTAFLLKTIPADDGLDSLKDESGEFLKDEKSTAKIKELAQKKNHLLASAQAAFEKAVELDSTDLEAQGHLAEIYQELENFDKALVLLETLVAQDSTNCKAWQQLAYIYAKRDVGKKATDAFQKAQDCFENKK